MFSNDTQKMKGEQTKQLKIAPRSVSGARYRLLIEEQKLQRTCTDSWFVPFL